MSSIRFGRGREYQFFREEDVRRRWDLRAAVQFLNGFRADPVAMATFRRQVSKEIGASAAKLSDEQVIQSLARMLVVGEFVVALPERQRHRDPLELREPVAAASAPRSSTPAEVVEDEPTFQHDHDAVMQAAVLIAAARDGVPFCEECAKRAAQQELNKAKQAHGTAAAKEQTIAQTAKQPAPMLRPEAKISKPAKEAKSNNPAAEEATSKPATEPKTTKPAAEEKSSKPPTEQKPGKPTVEKETYWVEIQLLGEDGRPIPEEEFVVELPDGKRATGFLDGKGLARFDGLLTSGTCKVRFPQLDADAWHLVDPVPKTAVGV
jgi:hypothetical protein